MRLLLLLIATCWFLVYIFLLLGILHIWSQRGCGSGLLDLIFHKTIRLLQQWLSSAVLFDPTEAPRYNGDEESVSTLPECVGPSTMWKPHPARLCFVTPFDGPDPSV